MAILKVEINDVINPTGWGGVNPADVKAQLEGISASDELEVHINSPGGDYFAGSEIAEAIRACKPKRKRGYVTGNCASAATYALLECDERWISPLGMILIHEPAVYVAGKAMTLRAVANELDLITEALIVYYAGHLKASEAQVREWISELPDGHTFNAPDAIKYGWVKGVTTSNEKEEAKQPSRWNQAIKRTQDLLAAEFALANLQQWKVKK